MNKIFKIISYFSLFIFTIFLDRITKLLALQSLLSGEKNIFPFLNLSLAMNRGVSFGMFHFKTTFTFIALATFIFFVIVAFGVYTVFRFKKNKNIFFETLVLAGALSNFVDRILYGGVIDFIDFYISSWHWPTFNFADMFIFVGIAGMFIRSVKDNKSN